MKKRLLLFAILTLSSFFYMNGLKALASKKSKLTQNKDIQNSVPVESIKEESRRPSLQIAKKEVGNNNVPDKDDRFDEKIFQMTKAIEHSNQEQLDIARLKVQDIMRRDPYNAENLVLALNANLHRVSAKELLFILESFVLSHPSPTQIITAFLSQEIEGEDFLFQHHVVSKAQKKAMAGTYALDKIVETLAHSPNKATEIFVLKPYLLVAAQHAKDLMLVRHSLTMLKEYFELSSIELSKTVSTRDAEDLFAYSDLLENE